LHIAALEDSYKTVVVLVTNGADISIQDTDGHTPLMICKRTRNEQMIALIEENKATSPKSPKSKKAKRSNKKSSDQHKNKRKNCNDSKENKNKLERNTSKRKRIAQHETNANKTRKASENSYSSNKNNSSRKNKEEKLPENLYETIAESLKLPTSPIIGQQIGTEEKTEEIHSNHSPEGQAEEESFKSILYDTILQTFDSKKSKKDSFENHFADGLFTDSNILNFTDQIPSIMTPPSSSWSPNSSDSTPEIFKF